MIHAESTNVGPIRLELREEWIPLLLHKYIVDKLHANPSFVLDIAAENLLKSTPASELAHTMVAQWYAEWVSLVVSKDIEGITAICLGEMVHDADMRQVSPFLGVLTQEERSSALRDARLYWELYKSHKQQGLLIDWFATGEFPEVD